MSDLKRFIKDDDKLLLNYLLYTLKQASFYINRTFFKKNLKQEFRYYHHRSLLDLNEIYIDSKGFFCTDDLFSVSDLYIVNETFIRMLKQFDNLIERQPKLTKPLTVFRGCRQLQKRPLKGIICTSKNIDVAKKRATENLLEITVPGGEKIYDVNAQSVQYRTENEFRYEQEVLIPAPKYKVTDEQPNKIKGYYCNKLVPQVSVEARPGKLTAQLFNVMQDPDNRYRELLTAKQLDEFDAAMEGIKNVNR
jgi:hypothetical protein